MDDSRLDWDFFQNSRNLFETYNKQAKLITNLFTQISNQFPQNRLKAIFENSKGSKISKGYNLGGFPYQVLDLVRDFDKANGFNLRLLAWWGNGLYVFLTYGYVFARSKTVTLKQLQPEFLVADPDLLFNYPKLIETKELQQEIAIENQIAAGKVIQLWKPINLDRVSVESAIEVENLLGRLLDIHS